MLSLDIGERDLVLPRNEVSDFVDSLWEALPFLRSRLGGGLGEGGGSRRMGGSGNGDSYV